MADEPAKVAIYGAQWCPPCHAAKAYLNSRNIAYDYIDIDTQQDKGREIAMKTDRAKIDNALSAAKLI
jgi:glutaredoxin